MRLTQILLPLLAAAVSACASTQATTKATDESPMNVLLIMADDLNMDVGAYKPGTAITPNIDRLAERSVQFERAYVQYPMCGPSRASMMTGLYPHQAAVLDNEQHFRYQNPDVVTLPQLFKRHGYQSIRVGKIYHYGVPAKIGLDGRDDPASWHRVINPIGRDKWDEHLVVRLTPDTNLGGTLAWLQSEGPAEEQTDGFGATAAIEVLKKENPTKTGKPLFLAVGFYRPHTPFVAPKRFFDLYDPAALPIVEHPADDRDDIPTAALNTHPGEADMTEAQKRTVVQAYYASISLMDEQVGRVLDALRDEGLADSTLVVFTSDHGYQLGRHGLWQKGDLFEESQRVPLLVYDPRHPERRGKTHAIVEMVDLYPTLAEMAGLPLPSHARGQSLIPQMRDTRLPGRVAALSVAHCYPRDLCLGFSIRTAEHRLTRWGDKGEHGIELYNYRDDPSEYKNLANSANKETLAQLNRLLDQKMQAAGVN